MFFESQPSPSSPRFKSSRLAWLCGLTALSTLMIADGAIAQTTLPDPALDLRFQTSGPRRCANIGDWYTTFGRGVMNDGDCGTAFGGPADTIGAPGFHTFFISLTEADLAGGPVSVTIEDPGSDNAGFDEVIGTSDPTRFTLFDNNGAVIQAQTFNDPTDPGTINTTPGSEFTFPAINSPGNYQIRSETGSFYLSGGVDTTLDTNDDDNSFRIRVPVDELLLGQQIGSFQQDSGGNINLDLFFLVGPGSTDLFLRNFDLDMNGDVSYTSPTGATPGPATESADSGWNGGPNDLNIGGDAITLNADGITDAGRWTFSIDNFTVNNQTIVEANDQTGTIPVFDQSPTRAGNFTITQDTTLTTTIGTEVCHPFTVTNNFFTTDIVNLSATGTAANVVAQLRDINGNPLPDTDGDGQVDTGILQPGQSVQFFLCVTPQAGAPSVDVTTITGTSFMDQRVREQQFPPGNPNRNPAPQSVEKRTLIPSPSIGLAKTNSALRPVAGSPGLFDVDLTFVVENTGNTVLSNVQILEDLQEVFVDNPQVNGAPSDGADAITGVSLTGPITFTGGGTAPTFNTAYDGNANTQLFNTGSSFNPGDTASITITVQLDLTSDGTVDIDNSAIATGLPPGSTTPVEDISQSGSDVDPDNDGDPTNNDVPNRIRIPSIGVAKTVSAPTLVGGTTFEFDYTIRVENTGTITLTDVQLTENLQAALIDNAFNRADSFTVTNVALSFPDGAPTVPPTENTVFNGTSVTTLFDGAVTNTFDPGDSAQVVITVQADLGAVSGTPSPTGLNDGILEAQNVAEASGNPPLPPGSPPGTPPNPVTDISQDGTQVDPDNDGNPNNNNTPTTVFVNTGPSLSLVKRITNVFRGGAPVLVAGLTQFNDQAGFIEDNALNTALGGGNSLSGIFELPAGFTLQSNDEVEYTIYFWNNGGSAISQLEVCDALQPPSVLNTAAGFELSAVRTLTIPIFFDAGSFVEGRSPGAPLDQSCIAAPGTFPFGPPGPTGGLGVGAGGGVVAGPFDVPPNQFGAIRFRVRIP